MANNDLILFLNVKLALDLINNGINIEFTIFDLCGIINKNLTGKDKQKFIGRMAKRQTDKQTIKYCLQTVNEQIAKR